MEDEIKNSEWISSRRAYMPDVKPQEPPKIDPEVSKLVGQKVFTNDPRLMKKVIEWKRNKSPDQPDNFLHDHKKREELRKIFR